MAWLGTTAAGKRASKAVKSKRRRARVSATSEGAIDRLEIFRVHGGRCHLCKLPIAGKFELDHIEPLAAGGQHVEANLAPAHPKCNRRKAARVGPRKKGLRRGGPIKRKPRALPMPTNGEEIF